MSPSERDRWSGVSMSAEATREVTPFSTRLPAHEDYFSPKSCHYVYMVAVPRKGSLVRSFVVVTYTWIFGGEPRPPPPRPF